MSFWHIQTLQEQARQSKKLKRCSHEFLAHTGPVLSMLLEVQTIDLADTVQALIFKVFRSKVVCGGVPQAAGHNAHGLPNLLPNCDLDDQLVSI
ncbi:hypothetical protein HaLaN_16698, partial [Haematococcus lacustris]